MSATHDIEFGYAFPGYGKYESPGPLLDVARATDEAGFETLWQGDHITIPKELRYDEYQFGTPDWADSSNPSVDVFQTFAHVAAVTDDVKLGTNICVVPLRHPIVLAKQALSLDALSEGRFEFGVGPGWLRSEFEVLDSPFEERGSRTDEFLRFFERAREEGEVGLDGPHHSFETTGFYPIPEEEGRPRIWVGGVSGPAFRRVAEFGVGWTIVNRTAEEVADARDRIMNAWDDFDREGVPEISARRRIHVGDHPDADHEYTSAGEPAEIIEDIEAYAEAGTTQLIVGTAVDTLEEELEQIRLVEDEIMPAFQ
ncbi:MAG: TIGR03619 family F420-dependent LLM class oxidoreductase [Haloferacaceae archaeon]